MTSFIQAMRWGMFTSPRKRTKAWQRPSIAVALLVLLPGYNGMWVIQGALVSPKPWAGDIRRVVLRVHSSEHLGATN